jgi:hypothetical protein
VLALAAGVAERGIAALPSSSSQSRYAASAHAFATTRAPLRGPIFVS